MIKMADDMFAILSLSIGALVFVTWLNRNPLKD